MAVEEKGEGLLVVGVMAVTVPVEVVPVEAGTAAVMVEGKGNASYLACM